MDSGSKNMGRKIEESHKKKKERRLFVMTFRDKISRKFCDTKQVGTLAKCHQLSFKYIAVLVREQEVSRG